MAEFETINKFISFVVISIAILYFPRSIHSRPRFSQCRPPVIKTSSLEVGDDVLLQSWISLGDGYSGEDLIWKKNRGDAIAVCLATTTQYDDVHTLNCSDISLSRYQLRIGNCGSSCMFDLQIENAVQNDSGLYF